MIAASIFSASFAGDGLAFQAAIRSVCSLPEKCAFKVEGFPGALFFVPSLAALRYEWHSRSADAALSVLRNRISRMTRNS